MTRRLLPGLALVAGCWGGDSADRPLVDFTAARPLAGEARLTAHIDFGAGTLRLRPATSGTLYRMQLGYDAERFEPVAEFDEGGAVVRLGVRGVEGGSSGRLSRDTPNQTATIELSAEVELLLQARMGAVDAVLELGGLRLAELDISTGASRSLVRFGEPNPGDCRRARIQAGAAELTVEGLGNSGCREIVVEGGVGRATVDFTGAWPADAQARLNMAIGGVRIVLPEGVGVRLTMDRFLASFQPSGLSQVDGSSAYQSADYDTAARKLEIAVSSTLGGVDVVWR